MIGKTLGHYRVVEEIGAGGMGVVYRAVDTRLNRDVALKVIRPGALSNVSSRERFRKEALLLSKLCHPNIAQVYDFDTQEGTDFLIMEYVKGEMLSQSIKTGPIPEETAIKFGIQIADALESAAEVGIVHRDLKPNNTMVTTKGVIKVLDFGLARLLRDEDLNATESMDSGWGGAGTLPYMAPEQLKGEAVDFRSDVYSLGEILYKASTGQRPFQSHNTPTLISDILHKSPKTPRQINPSLSAGFENILLRCLAKEPPHRYKNGGEVRAALESLLTNAVILPPKTRRLKPPSLRILAIAAISLLIIWFAVVVTWRSSHRVPNVNAALTNQLAVLPLRAKEATNENTAFDNGLVKPKTARRCVKPDRQR